MKFCKIYLSFLIILLALPLNLQAQLMETRMVGQVGGYSHAVAISGSHVFAGEGLGLAILDITDPQDPLWKSKILLPDAVSGIAIEGNYAFVAAGVGGLQVIDVSNKELPLFAADFKTADKASGIAIRNGLAYIAAGSAGIYILNISDPTDPKQVGRLRSGGSIIPAGVIAVNNDYAYICDTNNLQVIDISDPANPQPKGLCALSPSPDHYLPIITAIAVSDTEAYLATTEGLCVVHVSNPDGPTEGTALYVPYVGSTPDATGVAVIGNRAYVSYLFLGLFSLDITNPDSLSVVSSYYVYGLNTSMSVGEGFACMPHTSYGNQIIDLANDEVHYRGTYPSFAYSTSFAISNGWIFVPEINACIYIVDAKDVRYPFVNSTYKGDFPYYYYIRNVNVYGNFLYAFGDPYTSDQPPTVLHIIDITSPTEPVRIGSYGQYAADGWLVDVAPTGSKICIVDSKSHFRVIDASQPDQSILVATQNTLDVPQCVVTYGSIAYVASGSAGIEVYDGILDGTPSRVDTLNTTVNAHRLAISNGKLLVADGAGGLKVFDLTDPRHPLAQGSYTTTYPAIDLAASGDIVFLLSGWEMGHSYPNAVNILDLSDPNNPSLLSHYDLAGYYNRITTDGQYIYISGFETGLAILSYSPYFVKILSPNGGENGTCGEVSINWKTDLQAGTAVKLELWDDNGRVADLGFDWNQNHENTIITSTGYISKGSNYRVRAISSWNPCMWDESDAPFSLQDWPVNLISPRGQSSWKSGDQPQIHWSSYIPVCGTGVQIQLWRNGTLACDLGNAWDQNGEQTTTVTIPQLAAGSDYRLRITSILDPVWFDESDGLISIGLNTIDSGTWALYE